MKNKTPKKLTAPAVIQIRAEFGAANIKAFTIPESAGENLASLKEAIRAHVKGALKAEIQRPGEEPEIITLSRKPTKVLVTPVHA